MSLNPENAAIESSAALSEAALKVVNNDERDVAASYDGSNVVMKILRVSSWGPLLMNLGYHTGSQFLINVRPNLERAQRRLVYKSLERLDLRPDHQLLDIACGRGKSTFIAHCQQSGVRAVGMDFLEQNIHIADTIFGNVPDLTYTVGNAQEMPFPDESFDRAMCLEAAFHFPERNRFLQEACRVLRPGGRLVVVDFAWNTPAEREHRDHPLTRIVRDIWQWDDLFSIDEYQLVAKKAGFNTRLAEDWSPHVTRPFQRKFNFLCRIGNTPWLRRLLLRRNPMYRSLTEEDWSAATRAAEAHEHVTTVSKYMAFVFEKR